MSDTFDDVFAALRAIMAPVVEALAVRCDTPDKYDVDTRFVRSNGQTLWFGGVQRRKRYVSYHLMPVYVNPDLLQSISPALRKRMQGKSCFNFTRIDPVLFDELAVLTRRALADYERQGYL